MSDIEIDQINSDYELTNDTVLEFNRFSHRYSHFQPIETQLITVNSPVYAKIKIFADGDQKAELPVPSGVSYIPLKINAERRLSIYVALLRNDEYSGKRDIEITVL